MAALSEKVIWPIVAIFIFGVLAGFYIDDRRRLMENGDSANQQQASSSEHSGQTADSKAAESKQASNEHAGQSAENNSSSSSNNAGSKQTASSKQATGATSMDMNEYLAESSSERSAELEANVAHHQGFSGSIDEYLSGGKPKASNNMQADSNATNTKQAAGATSMSMDEYQAQANGKASDTSNSTTQQASSSSDAYHGGIDEYLAKYGDGAQTPVKKQSSDPFVAKENMGFHGSYEEYAKKYN